MAETTVLTISGLKVHGSGVASCGSYPDIKISATIEFTRPNPNDTTINWKVTSISWSHPTSGSYGFKFRCYLYLSIPGTYYELVMKNNTTASNWWNYTSLKKPSGSFTAGEGVTTVSASIRMHGGSDSCTSGSDHHLCYGSNTYRNIKTYTVTLPTYAPYYTISYNNNGGEGVIENQIKDPGQDINLTTDIPSFPVTITYHDNPNRIDTSERPFLNWLGNGTQYAPGDLYTIDASCEMVAQWGNATFTPVLPTKYVKITYSLDGGTLEPSYIDILRPSLGYDPNSSVTVNPQYPNGVEATTTSATLSLYPVYGNAVLPYANLPVPTKKSYRFDGWYYDAELQNPVEGDVSTAVDITLYAKWTYLHVHIFDNNQTWEGHGEYVWRFNGTVWQKIAHIYAFNGTSWIDQSTGDDFVEVTTAKAGIANFTTSLARPLVNLTSYFKATQEAGTPTPQSPKAISEVSAVNVFHRGFNLFDKTTVIDGEYINDTDGTARNDANSKRSDFIEIAPDTNYYIKSEQSQGNWGAWYDVNKNFISGINGYNTIRHFPVNARFARLTCYRGGSGNINTFCFNVSDASKNGQYEAYNGSTTLINLGGTYYGGYVSQDKDGKRALVVTHKKYVLDSNLTQDKISVGVLAGYTQVSYLPYIDEGVNGAVFICNKFEYQSSNVSHTEYKVWSSALAKRMFFGLPSTVTTKAEAIQWFTDNPTEIIAEFETPVTIPLTDGQPITAFNGVNNIYNDSSDSQVTFLATPQEAEAAQQRSLSKGSPSEEPEEEEEKPEEEPIEEPKDTGNER